MKTYILVGQPNSGKTTLYNWLTGSNYKTVNYPGSTIEYSMGSLSSALKNSLSNKGDVQSSSEIRFVDTPGTYSFIPRSPDEKVTHDVIFKNKITSQFQVLLVIDSLHLDRQLILAEQLRQAKINFSVILTMSDLLSRQGQAINIKAMGEYFGCAVVPFDGQTGQGLDEVIKSLPKEISEIKAQDINWTYLDYQRYRNELNSKLSLWLSGKETSSAYKWTKQIDRWALSGWGFVLFFLTMSLLFSSLFWFSTPFSDVIESIFGFISATIETQFPESFFALFVSQGIVASFAAVLVFVPQILFLFLGLGFLESSGYLPRAAALVDHPLKKIGLGGRSFVPLLSGFACAVPALMAARNISSYRDRMITLFVVPLMSCSARLPVYGLLLAFLFPEQPFLIGMAMTLIYVFAIVLGALASFVLSKILPPSKDQFFMMELPLYRKPRWSVLIKQSLQKTKSYVFKAGPIILFFAVLLWLGTQFPRLEGQAPSLDQSYAGQLGQIMEPVFKPMGVDWRVGVGLISAFAAREVFVSSMAVTFKVTADEDAQADQLLQVMNQAQFPDGTPIFTLGSVLGLIFFFMVALQCMSTVAMQTKESGSAKFAWGQLVILNLIAYVGAVLINQAYSFLFM